MIAGGVVCGGMEYTIGGKGTRGGKMELYNNFCTLNLNENAAYCASRLHVNKLTIILCRTYQILSPNFSFTGRGIRYRGLFLLLNQIMGATIHIVTNCPRLFFFFFPISVFMHMLCCAVLYLLLHLSVSSDLFWLSS